MKPALEDIVIGPEASPSLSEGFRWEDSRRRVRVVFADMTIAASNRVMLFQEFGRLPIFYFPMEDVHMDLLVPTDHYTSSPLKGEASYWTVRVGNRVAEHAAWSYPDPLPDGPPLKGYLAFYWKKMDALYEEEERVFEHARDPYKRVDILTSSRHVRVVLGGETIAETHRPRLLIETGLPIRYYIYTVLGKIGRKAVRKPLETVEGSLRVWRPWQFKQLELFQGIAFSTPSQQHFTQEYMLLSLQSGTVHLQYRNTNANGHVVDGTFLVIEPGETWICQPKNVTFHHLTIDPAWLQRNATELFQREKSLLHFPSQILIDPSLSKALCDLAAMSLSPASRLQQEGTQLYLLAQLLLSHTQNARVLWGPGWEHPAIKRAKEYLHAHYIEEIALQDLANVTHLSPFYLARIFRQVVGMPPHAYQTQLRLSRAKTLLAQGFEVGYVANETGFFDQSHFTQQFKRHFLVTPGSYRKTARFS